MSKRGSKLILTLPEYERIYGVIYSVLDGRADVPHACMFFSIVGSFILNKHYQIAARPVAGAFLLGVDSVPRVATFGKLEGNDVTSDKDGFHMWVQTEKHVVDFMAPIFNEAVGNKDLIVPRNMFQRLIGDEVASPDSIAKSGDYFTMPSPELSDHFVETFLDRASHRDLLAACDRWFKKYPKKLDDLCLMDDCGETYPLMLNAPPISGVW